MGEQKAPFSLRLDDDLDLFVLALSGSRRQPRNTIINTIVREKKDSVEPVAKNVDTKGEGDE